MTGWSMRGHERLGVALVAVAALAVGVAGGWQMRGGAASAQEDALATAKVEVERLYQALSGNAPLADVLGEAFQLIRTDGVRLDRDGYIAAPASLERYTLDDFRAIQSGDVLTVTFFAGVTGMVAGVRRDSTRDPRLAVFTRVDGAWKLQALVAPGQGTAVGLDGEAAAAVRTWVEAVASGDSEAIRPMLAPEFQIVRANGSAHDAAGYLAGGMAKIDTILGIEDVVVTGYDDHMVVRYALALKSSVDGRPLQDKASRLTVFRRHGDGWLVVAHANFALPQN